MSEPIIILENISKHYPFYHAVTGGMKQFLLSMPNSIKQFKKRYQALEEISFTVERGESFGLIGYNGAGKSTTLGLIAGVLKPSSGRITVKDRVSPLLQLGAGFHPELTGMENIMLNGVLMGLTRAEVKAKFNTICDYSELGDFLEQPIRVYSSGMLAKLGFSIVSHLDPQILLLDEILAVGDIKFQKKCMDTMESFINDKRVTLIMVSHSMDNIRKVCSRSAWIHDHKLRMIGPTDEVVDAYQGPPQTTPASTPRAQSPQPTGGTA